MKTYRKQRVKLVKDLEEGENTLCQSLLDMSEFGNIDQAYEKKKLNFNITKRNISLKPYVNVSDELKQYDMTPTEKLEYYKRKKIKQRYNNFSNSSSSIEMLKKMFKIRKSRIPTMLNNLGENMRTNVEEKFQGEIKKSEAKLMFFRSQGRAVETLNDNDRQVHQSRQSEPRYKFYSLKTGKPQMNEKLFPTFQQYVEGKKRAKLQQRYQFDLSKIEKGLSTFYTEIEPQNPESPQQTHRQSSKTTILSGRLSKASSNISSTHIGIMSQRALQSRTQNLKPKPYSNIERYSQQNMAKSELSSSKIVKTMTGFYKSKNNKKSQYNNMLEYYEHDRPLTNSIRRRQYLSIDKKLNQLSHYRNEAEKKRQSILDLNSKVYKQMLARLEKYHEDDIPVSLEILRAVRQLMRREYVFGEDEARKMLREVKRRFGSLAKVIVDDDDEKEDFMIQPVINVVNEAYGFRVLWVDV